MFAKVFEVLPLGDDALYRQKHNSFGVTWVLFFRSGKQIVGTQPKLAHATHHPRFSEEKDDQR
jgi:hypothetical protein